MTLIGESTIFRHGKAKTLYMSIPSGMATDSQFEQFIKEGDEVAMEFNPKTRELKVWNQKKP